MKDDIKKIHTQLHKALVANKTVREDLECLYSCLSDFCKAIIEFEKRFQENKEAIMEAASLVSDLEKKKPKPSKPLRRKYTRTKDVVEFMRGKDFMTTTEIANAFGLTESGVFHHLLKLYKKGGVCRKFLGKETTEWKLL